MIKGVLLSLILFITGATAQGDPARSITFINDSGRKLEVHWIAPHTGEMHLQGSIFPGSDFNLNSFVGHEFEIREMPGSKTGYCGDDGAKLEQCRTAYAIVSRNQEQRVLISKGLATTFQDDMTVAQDRAADLMEVCQQEAKRALSQNPDLSEELAGTIIDRMSECIENSVTLKLQEANEEIGFQTTIRKGIATLLENYTCDDESIKSSEPVDTTTWFNARENKEFSVLEYLNRKRAKIHVVKNFISREECEAMADAAEPLLHRATVADSDGGSRFSESRKAMQAGIKVPWHKEQSGNPIAVLSRRVFDYTNAVTSLNLQEHGQEDLMSIQYYGRNYENGEEPDRYAPHCDGDCTGLKHKFGTRVATMVMYCDVPEKGGMTQFSKAGVRVQPEFGSATFFSYIGDDGIMDNGLTEHSGCPVYKGVKRIVTQWMRLGVDSENPWDSWNTMGIKHEDAENA